MAVGDSFTFGDEVNDGQTWPAQLQQLTGRRVINGGVSGYGFDQTCCAPSSSRPIQAVGDRRQLHRRRHPPHRDAPPVERRQALVRSSTRTSSCCAACRCRRAPIPHHAELLAKNAGLLLPVRLHPAPPRPAARLVRRPRPRPSRGHRRAHCLSLTDRLAELQRIERRARACWWPSTIPWCGTIRIRGRAAPHDRGLLDCAPGAGLSTTRQLRAAGRDGPARASSTACGT